MVPARIDPINNSPYRFSSQYCLVLSFFVGLEKTASFILIASEKLFFVFC